MNNGDFVVISSKNPPVFVYDTRSTLPRGCKFVETVVNYKLPLTVVSVLGLLLSFSHFDSENRISVV